MQAPRKLLGQVFLGADDLPGETFLFDLQRCATHVLRSHTVLTGIAGGCPDPMRRKILKLHLWTALAAGPMLLILGMSGSILAFETEIDQLVHPGWYHAEIQGGQLPILNIVDAVSKAFPRETPSTFTFPSRSGLSCQILSKSGRQLFVDGHTGRVLGIRYIPSSFMSCIRKLHRRLILGTIGTMLTRFAAVALLILIISGLNLWWPLKRVSINGATSWRRTSYDVHNTFGFCSSPFLLILAVSGVLISLDAYVIPA